jgi:hypothetical protein
MLFLILVHLSNANNSCNDLAQHATLRVSLTWISDERGNFRWSTRLRRTHRCFGHIVVMEQRSSARAIFIVSLTSSCALRPNVSIGKTIASMIDKASFRAAQLLDKRTKTETIGLFQVANFTGHLFHHHVE